MTKRLFSNHYFAPRLAPARWLALAILIGAALAISACDTNLSGEPDIRREAEIVTVPTRAPSANPTPADEAAEPDTAPEATEPEATADTPPDAADGVALAGGDYDLGFEVYLRECASCHGAADGVGPGLRAMHDNASTRVAGLSAEEYVYQSIVEPGTFLVEGYPDAMPDDYAARLTEDEIAGLVTFVLEFDPARMGMGGGESAAVEPDTPADTAPDSAADGPIDAEDPVGPALESEDVLIVEGQLVMGTAGGDPIPEDLPLQLYAVDPHNNLAGVYETTTTANGAFAFENVARVPGMAYFVEVNYDGVPQGTRIPEIQGTEERVSSDVTLYERTTETDSVVITWAEMLINYAPIEQAGLEVWVDIELANTGDRIVTTDEVAAANGWFVSVEMELPVAAFGIQPMQAETSQRYQVEQIEGVPVVKDTWPLRPGQAHTITLAYYVPYSDGAVLEHGFNYPVLDGIILIPNDTVEFSSAQFDDEGDWRGRVTHGGVSVVALEPDEKINPEKDFTLVKAHELQNPISPDERMVFELDGRPTRTLDVFRTGADSGGDEDDNNLLALILAFAGGAIIMLAGVLWIRQRQTGGEVPTRDADRAPARTAPAWKMPHANAGKEELLNALADLDDAYNAGDIDAETYHDRRAILTERLLPLLDDDAES